MILLGATFDLQAMSETESPHDGIHPQALLLPWFLSGTLEAAERKQVTAHLAECAACRTELESLTVLRRLLRDSFSETEPNRSLADAARTSGPSRAASTRMAGGPLITPRFWGVLAACLIGIQLAVIVRLWTQPPVPAQLITRDLAPASPQLRCTQSDGSPGVGH